MSTSCILGSRFQDINKHHGLGTYDASITRTPERYKGYAIDVTCCILWILLSVIYLSVTDFRSFQTIYL